MYENVVWLDKRNTVYTYICKYVFSIVILSNYIYLYSGIKNFMNDETN